MRLEKLYNKFISRCRVFENRIEIVNSLRGTESTWKINYLTESLISEIWQTWCFFCRDLFVFSCQGDRARDGSVIAAKMPKATCKRICYIAAQTRQNASVKPNGHLLFHMRREPTWGDLDVFLDLVLKLQPTNQNNLISSFGSFTKPKHLQLVRNCCSHKNSELFLELAGLSTTYGFTALKHPCEIAWSNGVPSTIFAIELWLYEIEQIAILATKTN
jgi:hypothetical protein